MMEERFEEASDWPLAPDRTTEVDNGGARLPGFDDVKTAALIVHSFAVLREALTGSSLVAVLLILVGGFFGTYSRLDASQMESGSPASVFVIRKAAREVATQTDDPVSSSTLVATYTISDYEDVFHDAIEVIEEEEVGVADVLQWVAHIPQKALADAEVIMKDIPSHSINDDEQSEWDANGPSPDDVFEFVLAIQFLVALDGGDIALTQDQMKIIHAAVASLPATYPKRAKLLSILQSLSDPRATVHFSSRQFDGSLAFSSLTRVVDVLEYDGVRYADFELLQGALGETRVRADVVRVLVLVLGGDRESAVEVLEAVLVEIRADGEEESGMRDSTTTLVEEEEDVRDLMGSSYLVYTHDFAGAFGEAMGVKEGRRILKGVARMSGLGLCQGDVVAVLSGWHGGGVAPPRDSFVLPKDDKGSSERRVENGFDSVVLVRLETVEDLPGGRSEWVVAVLRERVGVPFVLGFSGNWVLENRVKDAFAYGAVRVGAEVVDALFA